MRPLWLNTTKYQQILAKLTLFVASEVRCSRCSCRVCFYFYVTVQRLLLHRVRVRVGYSKYTVYLQYMLQYIPIFRLL